MKELKCNSCGAPLKITKRAFRRGAITCDFCGTTYDLTDNTDLDEDVKAGLRLISKVKDVIGYQLDDINEPAEKPFDTKIELTNEPGNRFYARIPSGGFNRGGCFLILFTCFWCGFMVMWNVIGIATEEWAMVGFGALHDAVGIFLLLLVSWKLFGREELYTEKDDFVRATRILCFKRKKRFPLHRIEDVIFDIGNKRNSPPNLAFMVGSTKRHIATNAKLPEKRWLRTELLKFFQPRWQ